MSQADSNHESAAALQHLRAALALQPSDLQQAAAHQRLDYAVEAVLPAGDVAFVALRRSARPETLYLVRWPLIDSTGRALLIDGPDHQLEAFVRGGPLDEAEPVAEVGALIVVDCSPYLVGEA